MLSHKRLIPLYLRWMRRLKARRRRGATGDPRRAMRIAMTRHPRYR